MIKIAIFSTYDTRGGAARACARLNYGLKNHNEADVTYFVNEKKEKSNSTIVLDKKINTTVILRKIFKSITSIIIEQR
jgi:hypothetical protein